MFLISTLNSDSICDTSNFKTEETLEVRCAVEKIQQEKGHNYYFITLYLSYAWGEEEAAVKPFAYTTMKKLDITAINYEISCYLQNMAYLDGCYYYNKPDLQNERNTIISKGTYETLKLQKIEPFDFSFTIEAEIVNDTSIPEEEVEKMLYNPSGYIKAIQVNIPTSITNNIVQYTTTLEKRECKYVCEKKIKEDTFWGRFKAYSIFTEEYLEWLQNFQLFNKKQKISTSELNKFYEQLIEKELHIKNNFYMQMKDNVIEVVKYVWQIKGGKNKIICTLKELDACEFGTQKSKKTTKQKRMIDDMYYSNINNREGNLSAFITKNEEFFKRLKYLEFAESDYQYEYSRSKISEIGIFDFLLLIGEMPWLISKEAEEILPLIIQIYRKNQRHVLYRSGSIEYFIKNIKDELEIFCVDGEVTLMPPYVLNALKNTNPPVETWLLWKRICDAEKEKTGSEIPELEFREKFYSLKHALIPTIHSHKLKVRTAEYIENKYTIDKLFKILLEN